MAEINTNLDTTPLPPNNLVAKDPQSAELAGYVRTKTFGRDVRESIARSIELNSMRSKSAEILANETVNVANDLTDRFNQQIGALTEDSEVIDARDGELTLANRLIRYDFLNASPINKTKAKLWNKQPVVIVCFGDSVTWGYISSTEQSATNYPKMLQEKLRYIYGYDEIYVINRGYPGKQTIDALGYYSEVMSDSPDLVLVMFGLNDRGQRIYMDDYEQNLRQLVTQFKADSVEVILMSNTPSIMGNGIDGQSQNYRKVVKSLASEQGVDYIDVYGESMKLWETNALKGSDYVPTIHLYDYTFIADIVLKERLADIITIEASDGKEIAMVSPHIDRGTLGITANTNSKFKTSIQTSASTTQNIRFGIYSTKPFYLTFEGVSAQSGGSNKLRDFGLEVGTVDLNSSATNMANAVKPIYISKAGYHFLEFKGGEATATFRLNGFSISYNGDAQGTFEPSLISTTGTSNHVYSIRRGYYSRVGNLVTANIELNILTKDTGATGNLRIDGLPFKSKSGIGTQTHVLVRSANFNTTNGIGVSLNSGDDKLYLFEQDNTTNWLLGVDKIKDGMQLSATITYIAE